MTGPSWRNGSRRPSAGGQEPSPPVSRHKTVDASSNVTPCFLTFQWRRLSAVRCNRLLDCPRLAAARWLARLGIADTTERRSLFTASEVRNTDATSGSRTTATDAVPNCEANLFGLAFE